MELLYVTNPIMMANSAKIMTSLNSQRKSSRQQ